MHRTLKELHELMVEQVRRRGFYPTDEGEVMLHILEELGELSQSVRKGHSSDDISHEVADVFWHILRFCEVKEIDLEEAFMSKYQFNETRPLPNHDKA